MYIRTQRALAVGVSEELSSGNPNKLVTSLNGRNSGIRSVECTSSPNWRKKDRYYILWLIEQV